MRIGWLALRRRRNLGRHVACCRICRLGGHGGGRGYVRTVKGLARMRVICGQS